MTTNYMSPLVGMHFRPPAKAICECLPSGASLLLEPENDNQYDEYAIKVLVRPEAVPQSQQDDLREKCFSMGADWDQLLAAQEPIHLGYVISANNKKLGAWTPNTVIRDVMGLPNWNASLTFSPQGEPLVLTTVQDEIAEDLALDGET